MITLVYSPQQSWNSCEIYQWQNRAQWHLNPDDSTQFSGYPVKFIRIHQPKTVLYPIPDQMLSTNCVYIFLSIADADYRGLQLDYQLADCSPIIKYLRKNHKKCKKVHILPYDVPSGDSSWDPSDTARFEFQLWEQIRTAMPAPVQLYHYHRYSRSVPFADLYLYGFIKDIETVLGDRLNNLQISKKFSSLVNAARQHRTAITVLLSDFDSVLTHRQRLESIETEFTDARIYELYCKKIVLAKKRFSADRQLRKQNDTKRLVNSIELIQQGFCHIVTEDPFFDDRPRASDKTVKPFFARRPFLMLGSQGSLAWLQSHGFRTFSQWWDESYDQEPNHWRRLEKVYLQAEKIQSLTLSDCSQMLIDMQSVLDYNYRHLSVFKQKTFENINK